MVEQVDDLGGRAREWKESNSFPHPSGCKQMAWLSLGAWPDKKHNPSSIADLDRTAIRDGYKPFPSHLPSLSRSILLSLLPAMLTAQGPSRVQSIRRSSGNTEIAALLAFMELYRCLSFSSMTSVKTIRVFLEKRPVSEN